MIKCIYLKKYIYLIYKYILKVIVKYIEIMDSSIVKYGIKFSLQWYPNLFYNDFLRCSLFIVLNYVKF